MKKKKEKKKYNKDGSLSTIDIQVAILPLGSRACSTSDHLIVNVHTRISVIEYCKLLKCRNFFQNQRRKGCGLRW